MSRDSRTLRLDETPPGSLLAESVLDADGNVLLPRGAAVTAAIIDKLRASGVATLPILLPPQEGASREQEVAERLRHLFRNAGGNQPSLDLQRQLSAYRRTNDHD